MLQHWPLLITLAHTPPTEAGLKYSRNVTILACTIIVFGFLPGLKIKDFKPFGLPLGEAEWQVWILAVVVLTFYAMHLFSDLAKTVWTEHLNDGESLIYPTPNVADVIITEYQRWEKIKGYGLNTMLPFALYFIALIVGIVNFIYAL